MASCVEARSNLMLRLGNRLLRLAKQPPRQNTLW
jgi:hypothetical protein